MEKNKHFLIGDTSSFHGLFFQLSPWFVFSGRGGPNLNPRWPGSAFWASPATGGLQKLGCLGGTPGRDAWDQGWLEMVGCFGMLVGDGWRWLIFGDGWFFWRWLGGRKERLESRWWTIYNLYITRKPEVKVIEILLKKPPNIAANPRRDFQCEI